jgi:hypothetical protein
MDDHSLLGCEIGSYFFLISNMATKFYAENQEDYRITKISRFTAVYSDVKDE